MRVSLAIMPSRRARVPYDCLGSPVPFVEHTVPPAIAFVAAKVTRDTLSRAAQKLKSLDFCVRDMDVGGSQRSRDVCLQERLKKAGCVI